MSTTTSSEDFDITKNIREIQHLKCKSHPDNQICFIRFSGDSIQTFCCLCDYEQGLGIKEKQIPKNTFFQQINEEFTDFQENTLLRLQPKLDKAVNLVKDFDLLAKLMREFHGIILEKYEKVELFYHRKDETQIEIKDRLSKWQQIPDKDILVNYMEYFSQFTFLEEKVNPEKVNKMYVAKLDKDKLINPQIEFIDQFISNLDHLFEKSKEFKLDELIGECMKEKDYNKWSDQIKESKYNELYQQYIIKQQQGIKDKNQMQELVMENKALLDFKNELQQQNETLKGNLDENIQKEKTQDNKLQILGDEKQKLEKDNKVLQEQKLQLEQDKKKIEEENQKLLNAQKNFEQEKQNLQTSQKNSQLENQKLIEAQKKLEQEKNQLQTKTSGLESSNTALKKELEELKKKVNVQQQQPKK